MSCSCKGCVPNSISRTSKHQSSIHHWLASTYDSGEPEPEREREGGGREGGREREREREREGGGGGGGREGEGERERERVEQSHKEIYNQISHKKAM